MTKVLIESIVAEFYDGRVLIGRGVPNEWLSKGKTIEVSNFGISGKKRIDITIKAVSKNEISLMIGGDVPVNKIVFSLPVFIDNIAEATAGEIDNEDGSVMLSPKTRAVTVKLKKSMG